MAEIDEVEPVVQGVWMSIFKKYLFLFFYNENVQTFVKIKDTTNSHAPRPHPTPIWQRLRRTSLGGGGADSSRQQVPGRTKRSPTGVLVNLSGVAGKLKSKMFVLLNHRPME